MKKVLILLLILTMLTGCALRTVPKIYQEEGPETETITPRETLARQIEAYVSMGSDANVFNRNFKYEEIYSKDEERFDFDSYGPFIYDATPRSTLFIKSGNLRLVEQRTTFIAITSDKYPLDCALQRQHVVVLLDANTLTQQTHITDDYEYFKNPDVQNRTEPINVYDSTERQTFQTLEEAERGQADVSRSAANALRWFVDYVVRLSGPENAPVTDIVLDESNVNFVGDLTTFSFRSVYRLSDERHETSVTGNVNPTTNVLRYVMETSYYKDDVLMESSVKSVTFELTALSIDVDPSLFE